MPNLHYYADSMPAPQEFRKALNEMFDQYDPVDDLLRLQRELAVFEQKYSVSSEECYRLFHEGKMGDDPEIFSWVSRYEAFRDLKSAISEVLAEVAAEPQPVR